MTGPCPSLCKLQMKGARTCLIKSCHKAWVVVADGKKPLFMVNEGDDQDFNLRPMRKDAQVYPAALDWATDRPGRSTTAPPCTSELQTIRANTNWKSGFLPLIWQSTFIATPTRGALIIWR